MLAALPAWNMSGLVLKTLKSCRESLQLHAWALCGPLDSGLLTMLALASAIALEPLLAAVPRVLMSILLRAILLALRLAMYAALVAIVLALLLAMYQGSVMLWRVLTYTNAEALAFHANITVPPSDYDHRPSTLDASIELIQVRASAEGKWPCWLGTSLQALFAFFF